MNDIRKLKLLAYKNRSEMANMSNLTTVDVSDNTYTLDLANVFIKNFEITSADANAKTITLSNVPTTANKIVTVTILIVCTTAAAFTHPTGVVFAAGTPTFTTGQSYWVTYESTDGGTSWAGYSIRRT